MSIGAGKVVCVTGASGYIASWLVKLLLDRGYTVNATVRDPDNPKKTEHLRALGGAQERLRLFKAELVEEGSFNSAVDGCVCVFHTASPVTFTAADPQAEVIEPALKGTLNVLKSCAKVHTIKRVVVTSSMATVLYNGRPLTEDVVVDETWFSDPYFCKEKELWYMLSKTAAEEVARKFAKENDIDIVFLNPGLVIGPLLQPTLNFSTEVIMGFITVQVYPATSYRFVDVRDVANAHIQALENPSAKGRYCLVGKVAPASDVRRFLCESYPTIILPEKSEDGEPASGTCQVSKEKAESLGIKFMPLEQSLRDTIESFKDKNFLSI